MLNRCLGHERNRRRNERGEKERRPLWTKKTKITLHATVVAGNKRGGSPPKPRRPCRQVQTPKLPLEEKQRAGSGFAHRRNRKRGRASSPLVVLREARDHRATLQVTGDREEAATRRCIPVFVAEQNKFCYRIQKSSEALHPSFCSSVSFNYSLAFGDRLTREGQRTGFQPSL
ncbi:hypothetical protein AAC387_Pa02g2806 [Persea americana]